MTRTERGVEVPLAAGRQDDKDTAAGVACVDLQLRYRDVCLKRNTALAQPVKSRQNKATKVSFFTFRSNGTVWTLQ